MGRFYCCMPECHNYSISGNIITLHKLPTKESVRRAWILAISRKNWKPTAYTRVCSEHFLDGVGPNSVHRNKIPTDNLTQ
ncbi:THAP1-like protein [Mya arenaria]|uniref:THAP1-like protein n=1 Tax=Mya arenaria TaxID=6604 RepID=A0ABY7FUK7_MYAAR|nr:THAP1-like protein [Mya arenaria]